MGRKKLKITAVATAILLFAGLSFGAGRGDVDGDGTVELKDAVLGLQNAAGLRDLGNAGLDDTISALQTMVGIVVPLTSGDFTNDLGMAFNLIPAGTFMMGSPPDELGRFSGEILHQVTLTQDFYIMTTEVTQSQWTAVMGSNPSRFTACGDDCPVERVSWDDIQGFITAMNERGEGTYRLPTEAEWEYAARAGNSTAFYNGDITETDCSIDTNLDQIGWYCGNSGYTTHPVAQKLPNDWGLYDMSGNVNEWCQDGYGTYPSSAVTDPENRTGSYRVLRGGSWNRYARGCRSAYRGNSSPSYRINSIGFRLAFSPGR